MMIQSIMDKVLKLLKKISSSDMVSQSAVLNRVKQNGFKDLELAVKADEIMEEHKNRLHDLIDHVEQCEECMDDSEHLCDIREELNCYVISSEEKMAAVGLEMSEKGMSLYNLV